MDFVVEMVNAGKRNIFYRSYLNARLKCAV